MKWFSHNWKLYFYITHTSNNKSSFTEKKSLWNEKMIESSMERISHTHTQVTINPLSQKKSLYGMKKNENMFESTMERISHTQVTINPLSQKTKNNKGWKMVKKYENNMKK